MTAETPDLDAIRARLGAATPGPWKYRREILGLPNTTVMAGNEQIGYVAVGFFAVENGEFIAHAPEDIAYLLAELAKSNAERDALRARIEAAPHEQHCGGWERWRSNYTGRFDPSECDCFKSAALAGDQPEHGEASTHMGTPEPPHLDPLPWVGWGGRLSEPLEPCEFDPRPEFEQDPEKYGVTE